MGARYKQRHAAFAMEIVQQMADDLGHGHVGLPRTDATDAQGYGLLAVVEVLLLGTDRRVVERRPVLLGWNVRITLCGERNLTCSTSSYGRL